MDFLRQVSPMGIYETLYAFRDAFGATMGDPGTHPWSQGYPRTKPLPGGPALPASVAVDPDHLKYPKAWGLPALRDAIAGYYRRHYDAPVVADNVMVFAGGRPAIFAVLLFLAPEITIAIASTEYTPYYDILHGLSRDFVLVPSTRENRFRPAIDEYLTARADGPRLVLISNPCNPTGVTRAEEDLARLVAAADGAETGVLVDEAYELLHTPPVSAMRFVRHLDRSNLFVVGAATKGLQSPGIRIGWVVAAKQHIESLSNFSTFGMGGVSHPSQCYALALLEPQRVDLARRAVPAFYQGQRERYGEAFERIGLAVHSGSGGFYHWCELPEGITAATLNQRLFQHGAAILKGTDCDMARRGEASPLARFFRFSFGALDPSSFDSDIALLGHALAS